jgi:hypothetical protein
LECTDIDLIGLLYLGKYNFLFFGDIIFLVVLCFFDFFLGFVDFNFVFGFIFKFVVELFDDEEFILENVGIFSSSTSFFNFSNFSFFIFFSIFLNQISFQII